MRGVPEPIIAFSTLGCPEWDLATVVERATRFGYTGIEWRGGPDGTVRTGWDTRRRRAARSAIEDAGLRSVAVTAYTNLIGSRVPEVHRSLDELRAHVDLAHDLGAGAVRVFLGTRDDDAPESVLVDRAWGALTKAAATARAAGVVLAIEPHDDFVRAEQLRRVLASVPDLSVAVAWDIANAWSVGEHPDTGLASYAGRIAYVQVKDGTGQGADWRLCLPGDGEVPLAAALRGLVARAYAAGQPLPAISVEWERAWHQWLEPPDVALPAGIAWVRAILAEITSDERRISGGGR